MKITNVEVKLAKTNAGYQFLVVYQVNGEDRVKCFTGCRMERDAEKFAARLK